MTLTSMILCICDKHHYTIYALKHELSCDVQGLHRRRWYNVHIHVREIIHLDYLYVQMHKPWYNAYKFLKLAHLYFPTLHNDEICISYTMLYPPVRGDNPRALASGLSYVQVKKNHGISSLYHLHQCRPCTLQGISC